MTYLIIGRKGGGKSAVMMHKIFELLLDKRETRPIITNLDIRERRLAEEVHRRGGTTAGRLYVRRSRESRTNVSWQRQFWRDRGDDKLIVRELIGEDGYRSYNIPSNAEPRHGCIYVIDETGDAFGNREWAKFAAECGWYMRAERHLGDDCYLLCQNEGLLDVTFSKLFNEVWRIWAGWRVLVWGVKMPKKFKVNVHHNIEDNHQLTVNRHMEFKMDKKILDCYRTNSLGGGKVKADKGAKEYGLPFWTLPVGVCALLLVLGLGIRFGTVYAARSFYNRVMHISNISAPSQMASLHPTDSHPVQVPKPLHGGTNAPPDFMRRLIHEGTNVVPPEIKTLRLKAEETPGPPVLLGWSLELGERTVYWVKTQYGDLRVPELMAYHGQLLHLGGGRWRVGHEPEGFTVSLPDGWKG